MAIRDYNGAPGYIPLPTPGEVNTQPRLTGPQFNFLATPTNQDMFVATDEPVPIVYGRQRIGGQVFFVGTLGTGELVLGLLWCHGEIDSVVSVYLNDAAVPGSIVQTHYTGTTSQTADATIVAAALNTYGATYTDTLVVTKGADTWGYAYSVLKIPTGGVIVDNTLDFSAEIKGKKIVDPRVGGAATWTENPALHLYDLLSSTVYGKGLSVTGADDAADFCDETVDAATRCLAGLTISEPALTDNYAAMLAEYAECILIYDGDSLSMVPDKAESVTDGTLTIADMSGYKCWSESVKSAPTQIDLSYSVQSGGAAKWTTATATVKKPGVDDGLVSLRPSTVNMPGVYRATEADRKAANRLTRLSLTGRHSWQAFDIGYKYRVGAVVLINRPDKGIINRKVRITSQKQVAAGRYAFTATDYSDAQYQGVTNPDATSAFAGLIAPQFTGDTTPSGWTAYNTANGKHIAGADAAYSIGDTGSDTSVTIAGTSSTNGAHTGSTLTPAPAVSGSGSVLGLTDMDASAGDHAHTYSKPVTPEAAYKTFKLIKCVTPGQVPKCACALADGELTGHRINAMTDWVGRFIKAGTDYSIGGNNAPAYNVPTSDAGAHDHRTGLGAPGGAAGVYDYVPAGDHSHATILSLALNVKRYNVALYGSDEDFAIIPGMIFLYEGLIGSLPANWSVVTDADGRQLQIGTKDTAGTQAGDNTATWNGSTVVGGSHNHAGGYNPSGTESYTTAAHADDHQHSHVLSGSDSFTPPYYALALIRYDGP